MLLKPGRRGRNRTLPHSVQEGDKELLCPAQSQVALLRSLALGERLQSPAQPRGSTEHRPAAEREPPGRASQGERGECRRHSLLAESRADLSTSARNNNLPLALFFFFLIKCCHSFQPLTPNGRSRAFPSPSLELGTWNKAINSRTHPSSPSNALQRHFIALPLCVEKRHPPSLSKTLNILKIAIPVLQKHTGASIHGDLCR